MRRIYFIGGSPCSGKTTIAQQIAEEKKLLYFSVDDELGKYAQMGSEKAFANWMERDALFAEEVRRQCEEAGYLSCVTDGREGLAEMKKQIEDHFWRKEMCASTRRVHT